MPSTSDLPYAESEHASDRLLAAWLQTIGSKRLSVVLRPGFPIVAHAGLIAAAPLSLSARLKRESDRGRHEARRASVFVNPALIAAMSAKASFIAGRLLPAANTAPATEELASTS